MKRKGFTLVEMLIVVVIIGILASALIPRLTGAQARARDVARQGHLNQISTALSTYSSDRGVFPWTGWETYQITGVTNALVPTYIKSIPNDPQSQRTVEVISNSAGLKTTDWWVYAYAPLTRNAWLMAWMVLVANTESEGKNSNWVRSPNYDETNYDVSLSNNWAIKNESETAASDNTSAEELEKTICKDGVSLGDAADLNWCVASTNAEMLYFVTQ